MLRNLALTEKGLSKIKFHGQTEFFEKDFDQSIKSFTPGEWVILSGKDFYGIGFVNPTVDEKFPCAHLVKKNIDHKTDPWMIIEQLLTDACEIRTKFEDYNFNSRLFYGIEDGLAGLIVDSYVNCAFIQINTAGLDIYRDKIKDFYSTKLNRPIFLLDNPKYREREKLPIYNEPIALDLIAIQENANDYKIPVSVMQKVGYYYDHRENRKKLQQLISSMNHKPQRGLDLFCYVGSWGLNALKGGCKNITFVDQGQFEETIKQNLEINKFSDSGSFFRKDVFQFLDDEIAQNKKYDLIISDPPAFAKNQAQQKQAIEGYNKVHRKMLKLSTRGTILVFGSCTHYVGMDEFEKNIHQVALKENIHLQLLYSGLQGMDHPIQSTNSKSLYLKCLIYIVR